MYISPPPPRLAQKHVKRDEIYGVMGIELNIIQIHILNLDTCYNKVFKLNA